MKAKVPTKEACCLREIVHNAQPYTHHEDVQHSWLKLTVPQMYSRFPAFNNLKFCLRLTRLKSVHLKSGSMMAIRSIGEWRSGRTSVRGFYLYLLIVRLILLPFRPVRTQTYATDVSNLKLSLTNNNC